MKTIITSVFFILTSVMPTVAKDNDFWCKDLENAKQLGVQNKNLIVMVVKDSSYWSEKLEMLVRDFSHVNKNATKYTFCTLFSDSFSDPILKHVPNIVLMHPEDGIIARIGYMPMDMTNLENYIKTQVKNFDKIKETALNAKKYDSNELEKAFLLSKQIGCSAFQNQLIEEGSKRLDTAFFAFEKYEEVLNKFSYDDERVKFFREEVELKDPKNIQKYHLKIAILDFLKLSDGNYEPKNIIKPLLNYIEVHGQKDRKSMWKIYMTISQFFLGKKDYYQSLYYARLSHKKAPRSVKKHVQASIKYLRRKVNIYSKRRK